MDDAGGAFCSSETRKPADDFAEDFRFQWRITWVFTCRLQRVLPLSLINGNGTFFSPDEPLKNWWVFTAFHCAGLSWSGQTNDHTVFAKRTWKQKVVNRGEWFKSYRPGSYTFIEMLLWICYAGAQVSILKSQWHAVLKFAHSEISRVLPDTWWFYFRTHCIHTPHSCAEIHQIIERKLPVSLVYQCISGKLLPQEKKKYFCWRCTSNS